MLKLTQHVLFFRQSFVYQKTFKMATNSRFESVSTDEVNAFLTSERNKNTVNKTKSDVTLMNLYLKPNGETREINHIPPRELNDIMCMFLLSVRRKDGSE